MRNGLVTNGWRWRREIDARAPWRTCVSSCVVLLLASGCLGTHYAERVDELLATEEWSYAKTPVDGVERPGWCTDLQSPELERFVARAFYDNLSLQAAWARLEQADAQVLAARSPLWPTINGDVSATRTEQPSFSAFGVGFGAAPGQEGGASGGVPFGAGVPGADEPRTINFYRVSLAASYEIDLWGRLASELEAVKRNRDAVRADARAMGISLAAQVAEAWLNGVYQRQRLALLDEQIAVAERYRRLLLMRFGQGASDGLAIAQQDGEVEALRTQRPAAEGELEAAQHQLAVLLGEPPGQLQVTTSRLPPLPPLPETGLPADLLVNRPDLSAALLRLESADAQAAAAVADSFPAIRLSASLFLQAIDISNILDQVFWSIMGSLTQPFFDGGRRWAEIERTRARARELLYTLAEGVFVALGEVSDTLVLDAYQDDTVEGLSRQLRSARQAWELAQVRYFQGTTDYLQVLTALQTMQQVEEALLLARREHISLRIRLCRVLGGSWARGLHPNGLATESGSSKTDAQPEPAPMGVR